jgi:hypothetical protein
MGFTIEEKALLLECHFRNRVKRQPIKRLCCNYSYDSNQNKRFDKTKDAVALLICFLFDHLVENLNSRILSRLQYKMNIFFRQA